MKLCIVEDLDVDWTNARKTNCIIPFSIQLSVLVFQFNFSQNYLKDFCHRKFISTNPPPPLLNGQNLLSMTKVLCWCSLKCYLLILLYFQTILQCSQLQYAMTICELLITYLLSISKISSTNKNKAAAKGEDPTMDHEICS